MGNQVKEFLSFPNIFAGEIVKAKINLLVSLAYR